MANNYFTIEKGSGLQLNYNKTDFNVNGHWMAKFFNKKDAERWIEENGHRFVGIISKKPVKLFIKENCPVS